MGFLDGEGLREVPPGPSNIEPLGFLDGEGLREVPPGRPNIERWPPLEGEGLREVPPDPELSGSLKGEGLLEVSPDPSKSGSGDLFDREGLLEVPRGRLKIGGRVCLEGEGLREGALGLGRCPDLRDEPRPSWGDFRVENGDQSESLGSFILELFSGISCGTKLSK